MSDLVWIEYKELSHGAEGSENWPSLRDYLSAEPQDHEEDIARYLEIAPGYSGMGHVVGDILDPSAKVVLFPGTRTDGMYVWPNELTYYVRKYHVRVPQGLVKRMASLNWKPPKHDDLDWEKLLPRPKL
jgi:hypothetical protein